MEGRGRRRGLTPLCAIVVAAQSWTFGCGRQRHPEHEATSGRARADAYALGDADRLAFVVEGGAEALPEEGVARLGAPDAAPLSDEPLSFLLITVDTLRPDLGFMGYERPVSPNLDQFAQRSIVYEHAYAISTYTGFTIPPMMASRYPSEMPRTDRHEVKYLSQNVLLAERLRAAGYHTAGAASHFLFTPQLGWIDGFEKFISVPSEGTAPAGSSIDWYHSSRGLAHTAIQLLSDPQITSGPFFIWVHFVDPHSQYLEHNGFSNFGHDPRGLYDGEVAYTDFYIGQVLSTLAESPLSKHTAIIFTADHGEAFGEHGETHHGRHIWEEIVRIPLVVFVPGIAPRRIARRIGAVEIAPTILDLAKLPEDAGARGRSFASELHGATLPEQPILIDQPRNPYYPPKRAFIEGGYKLHDLPKPNRYLLFDLSRDPGETQDLVAAEPETFARILASYEAFVSGIAPVTPLPVAPEPSASLREKR
ncbi:MAG TPA: sulfatase [Polyangiaceae bacterium]|nr:sulfatase [Polyangiaceae bacterium]